MTANKHVMKPVKIKLNEIPEEGREYVYTQQTGELNESLRDLIENNAYRARLYIKPLNHRDFTFTGQIETETVEVCSLCGETFHFPTLAKVNEILIPAADHKDKEKQSRSNHFSELDTESVGVTEYKNDTLDLGESVHQAVALSVPFNPRPTLKENGDCSVCLKAVKFGSFNYDENMGTNEKRNPFEALKEFKFKTSAKTNKN